MAMPQIDLPNMTDTGKVLNMMRDAIISHDTRLQGLRDDLGETQKDVEGLKQVVLTGYGTELPLKEVVRNHDGYIKDLKYWGRFVGGALIIQTITFFFGVIVALVRFLPILETLAKKP